VFEFLRNPAILANWRQLGGLETLMSYGLKPSMKADIAEELELAKALAASLPKHHRQFLRNLSTSFACGDFFFVHAGVKPGVPLEQQRDEDLLWIRDDFLLCEVTSGRSSSTGTRRSASPTSGQTASTSIPAPMRPAG
jgi:serine/threonine protein phosphatase 1